MADVAARAGVSHQTVSRVLNDSPLVRQDTRERVLEAIRELGYRRNDAARMLATNRSGRIGMVASHLNLYGPSTLATAVQQAGHAAGYDVALVGILEFSAESLSDAVDRLLTQAVEAVVIAVAHRDAFAIIDALAVPVPVVLVEGVTAGAAGAAGIDQEAGARTATDHLLDLGHRAVAHVSGPLDWIEAAQRRTGWHRAHDDRDLLPGPELGGDWSAQSGFDAGLRIARSAEVTAVFVANDAMALGVLQALHQAGRRVPEDISVVGFDDVPEARFFWPPLTTVTQPFAELGRRTVELTVRTLVGEQDAGAELLAPQLVVRGSTAPPPSATRPPTTGK